VAGTYLVMPDNGFGSKPNSPDTLLRMYALQPQWRTASGGSGTVTPVDFNTGAVRGSFDSTTRITLNDSTNKLPLNGTGIVADAAFYPQWQAATNTNIASAIAVDPTIKAGRLLTGFDFDIEAVRKDKNGNFWFGDEFGPFLVKTDATGKVLKQEFSLPGVFAPQNPYRNGTTIASNLNSSQGFEGMAINPAGVTPALQTDRGVITQNAAILAFVAQTHAPSSSLPRRAWAASSSSASMTQSRSPASSAAAPTTARRARWSSSTPVFANHSRSMWSSPWKTWANWASRSPNCAAGLLRWPSPRSAPASGPVSTRASSPRSCSTAAPSCSPIRAARPNGWQPS
jgi:hypothetical protein